MNKTTKRILGIFGRYAVIVFFAIGNFTLIYSLLTPPTVKALAMALRPFYDIVVINNFIYVRGITTEIAPSCIIASAFFLMILLIFSTPEIKPKKRILALVISFAILFILNIARMVFLVSIIHSPHFDTAHWILQNLLSIVAVAAIWIGMVSLLRIRAVPAYSDLKYIYGFIKKPQQ